MRIQVLCDLQAETDRLFIAGSNFAKGDLRITKLLPALEKMGEKSPPMKRLAEMTGALLTSDTPQAALADLGVFLTAIMNTQGDTVCDGLAPAPVQAFFSEMPHTQAPYSALEPVITALTTTGPSRLQVIESAYENGTLSDYRLYGHLSKGLEDKFADIKDYLANTVIPALGTVMSPFLLADLTMEGAAAAKRLALLDKLGYQGALALAEKAVNDGCEAVQIEAIKILGRNPDNEALLLSLADDKKQKIREAALMGLVRMDSAEGKEKMIKTLLSKRSGPAMEAAALCKDPAYTPQIFEAVNKSFAEALAGKKIYGQFNDFIQWLVLLKGKDEPYIHDFLIKLFDHRQAQSLSHYIPDVLESMDNAQVVLSTYKQIAVKLKEDSHSFFNRYFLYAAPLHSPAQLYELFAPVYEKGRIPRKHFESTAQDERWVDLLIKKDDVQNLGALLQTPARERILKYLKRFVHKNKKENEREFGLAAHILVENLDAHELKPIAEDVCESVLLYVQKSRNYYDGFNTVRRLILEERPMAKKLFVDSGATKYLEKLRDLFNDTQKIGRYYPHVAEVLNSLTME